MKYLNIMETILADIKKGNLKRGDRLPSIRRMTEEYGVNKSTVIKAYEELEREHYVYSIARSGYYVIHTEDQAQAKDHFIDMTTASPGEKMLPYREFKHCINRAIESYKSQLFGYGDIQGLKSLRKALSNYFTEQDIYASADEIYITNGAHQAISLLCHMNFPNGKKKILIEQPTYMDVYDVLRYNRCEWMTVPRDERGVDLVALEEAFQQDVKFYYTMSRFHNPLGTYLSLREKKKILELASKYQVYIVEDDYMAELEDRGKHLPLFYYEPNGYVIHIRSFSKSFMPGIRLGCIVAREKLRTELLNAKKNSDNGTSVMNQAALELYITSGMYDSHTKRMKEVYGEKCRVFQEQIMERDPEFRYIQPLDKGLVFWVNLYEINAARFVESLQQRGVKVYEGKLFLDSAQAGVKNGFRVSLAIASLEQIRHAVQIIYDMIEKSLKRPF